MNFYLMRLWLLSPFKHIILLLLFISKWHLNENAYIWAHRAWCTLTHTHMGTPKEKERYVRSVCVYVLRERSTWKICAHTRKYHAHALFCWCCNWEKRIYQCNRDNNTRKKNWMAFFRFVPDVGVTVLLCRKIETAFVYMNNIHCD